jgi:hypothetical protein
MSDTKNLPLKDWDVRVRERNLKNGKLTDKTVDQYLTELPDAAEQAEPFDLPQPALGGRDDS